MILVGFLICFFLFLVLYQFFIKIYNYKEGIDETTSNSSSSSIIPYGPTTTDDSMLPQKNKSNIITLDEKISKLETLSQTVSELSTNYTNLNDQVQGLVKQQADYATSLNGGSDQPITVTGI